ncbi:hypothetical protein [Marinoscillum furvescens]|uniref:Uncharacterized protein n=1 Tax=Marinoscillum furvescens DSM 4134 TaxID=1122208 RepID=A0A3D9L886_MARFU|nr:hypothetical protein [Marinoscillum furvescens]REE01087.1 hypothetical protein C7460_104107 [Marinoscillum furvescens DSM 4134]
MKLLVDKSAPEYQQLISLLDKRIAYDQEANKITKEVGAKAHTIGIDCFAGGISAFQFDSKPDGYRNSGYRSRTNLYFPKKIKANKELLERIAALPKIRKTEFKAILNFDSIFACPGLEVHKRDIIITANEKWVTEAVGYDDKWEVPDFLRQLTVVEYQYLTNKQAS